MPREVPEPAQGLTQLHEFCRFLEVTSPYASRHEPNPDKEKGAAGSYEFFSTMELHGPSSAHWPQPRD